MTTPPSNKKLGLRKEDEDGSSVSTDQDDSRQAKKARHQYQAEEQKDVVIPEESDRAAMPRMDTGELPAATAVAASAASKRDSEADTESRRSSSTSLKDSDTGDGKMDDRLTFPERLMHLLQSETQPDALWWQKDGLSFGFEPKVFTEKVLNKLFPSKIKFESFIRKLNRWGFRRVPGQGLPPNGAAYKHPLFKKSEPELMKSMKFGQKGEAPPKPSPFLNLDPASAALARAAQLPSGFEQALVGQQSMMANQAQTLQNLQQQQAFLQTLASNQQRQAAVAAGYLAQQQFATDALTTSTESEADLRNRLLFGSIPGGSLASFQLQSSRPQFMQRHSSQVGQQGAQLPGTASALGGGLSDMEWRNRLLLGSGLSSSSDPSQQQQQQQQQQHSSQAERLAATMGDSRATGNTLGANPSSQVDLSSRFLLGGTSFSSTQSQRQEQSSQSGQSPSGILDQLTLLRQQQAMRSRDPTADLLYLLEQERQRNQGNQDG